MKLRRIEIVPRRVTLSQPYRIAGRTRAETEIIYLTMYDDKGQKGYGSASPMKDITGETLESTIDALENAILPVLHHTDVSDLGGAIGRATVKARSARAALAAVDIALHDLQAKHLGIPLVEMLGGAKRRLFTSITVGIGETTAMADEAAGYAARGFKAVKVKIGEDPGEDIERLKAIRSAVGPDMMIRVDANEGYPPDAAVEVARELDALSIELFEQPVAVGEVSGLRRIGVSSRLPIVLDESVHVAGDLEEVTMVRAAQGANIKLMKCGGVLAARQIDDALASAGWSALVGCTDESCSSIAAAAHFAAAAASVAWIDLDGHFDLEQDAFKGGVRLHDGELVLSEAPGLGVEPS